jgi:ribosomal protein L37AE/L43A
MPVVEVADVSIQIREVWLPDACPQCKADLSERSSLQVWQYNEAWWPGHLGSPDEVFDEMEGGVAVEYDPGSESGDHWLPTVAYYCNGCGRVLAEGGMEHRS